MAPGNRLKVTSDMTHTPETEQQHNSHGDGTHPRVLAVVSCGATKQDLRPGERVPARELYSSSVHVCKDRYGRNSHGYYIASAKYGLIHSETEIGTYDQTLSKMASEDVEAWAEDVAVDLEAVVREGGYNAVVFIAGEDYINPLRAYFPNIDADILTPWQTSEYVNGVGRGMAWCNDEANWPVNVASVEEIGEVVG